jgi:hypothetical protein
MIGLRAKVLRTNFSELHRTCIDFYLQMSFRGSRAAAIEESLMRSLRDFSLTAFARNDINRQHINLSESSAAKYVREQEKHDQMMDRISRKEAEDPFRGS